VSLRLGYLGPERTFCHQGLRNRPEAEAGAQQIPVATVARALDAVRSGELDAAMVPIENSIEGGVPATLDALNTGERLVIVGETLVPITFVLAAAEPLPLTEIRTVGTHPHAWAQVRGWMAEHAPQAQYVPASSTAAGPDALRSGQTPFDATVCSPLAAEGLTLLATRIEDNDAAVTRFAFVAKPGWLPEHFAARGINMTRLESRPTKSAMGSYCFSIDFEGHVADERVGEALMGLHRVAAEVRFLGSYPRADEQPAEIDPAASDDAFVESRDWLTTIRAR
jgi:prephenate dehydratase